MSVAENDLMLELENKQFINAVNAFDIRKHTQAPLRMHGIFQFDVSADTVFKRITDPQMIASWFNLVKGGEVDHSGSCNVGQWGEGSKRYCYTSMGTLDETMYYWKAPYISAYNVKAWSMPVKDHCAVMIVKPTGSQSCELTWMQYFNLKGLVMKHFFPNTMLKMMNTSLLTLTEELGGTGGKMELIKEV